MRITEISLAYLINLFYETGLEALQMISIASNCIVLNRIEIGLHCIVIGVKCVGKMRPVVKFSGT